MPQGTIFSAHNLILFKIYRKPSFIEFNMQTHDAHENRLRQIILESRFYSYRYLMSQNLLFKLFCKKWSAHILPIVLMSYRKVFVSGF